MEDTRREVEAFPRKWRHQHRIDVMHEREFALVATGRLSADDLWSHYLTVTRKTRLKRMRAARRKMTTAAPAPASKRRLSRADQIRAMLPGKYIVTVDTAGSTKGDRLIVRQRNGVFDGYYVHQHGSLAVQTDQFSVQVGQKGAVTLLPKEYATGNHSQSSKMKATWRLHRDLTEQDSLVWEKRVKHRSMVRGKVQYRSSFERIEWTRSHDETPVTGPLSVSPTGVGA